MTDDVNPDEPSDGPTDRQLLLSGIACLDAADRLIHQLGHEQAMSIGPVISEMNDLRNEVVERGRNYGVLEDEETAGELLHEVRTRYEVRIERTEDSDE